MNNGEKTKGHNVDVNRYSFEDVRNQKERKTVLDPIINIFSFLFLLFFLLLISPTINLN